MNARGSRSVLFSLLAIVLIVFVFVCRAWWLDQPLKVNQLYGEWHNTDDKVLHLTITLLPDGKFTIARELVTQTKFLSMPASKHDGTWGLSGPNELWFREGGNPPIHWHDVSVEAEKLRCRIDDVYFSYVRAR
jgi:uncharacterized membrane protein YwzB